MLHAFVIGLNVYCTLVYPHHFSDVYNVTPDRDQLRLKSIVFLTVNVVEQHADIPLDIPVVWIVYLYQSLSI